MSEPIIAAARALCGYAFDVLRRAATGLDPEALDWEPGATEHTNSITVLTTHAMHTTHMLLSVAVGLPEPDRSHEAEFATVGKTADDVLGMIDEVAGRCFDALDGAPNSIDWSEVRPRIASDGTPTERTAAWYIVHAVDHLRGHADEAALTRHVWDAQG